MLKKRVIGKVSKFLLWKFYFDKGMGLTNYFKYLIVAFGFASNDVKNTLIIAFAYTIFSFFLGWFWCHYGWTDIETEVGNRFNPFCSDVRTHLKKRNI